MKQIYFFVLDSGKALLWHHHNLKYNNVFNIFTLTTNRL
jgi:hypothetical protein